MDTYIDRAMTGTNENRAAFPKMLLDSNKRAWDYVIVYKLDRFSRNKYETAVHKKTLRDNGVKLLSAMENIPDSPEGIILESLLEGMAEYYSAELSQKVKRGLKESRLKGNFTGGQVVYGYKVENKKVVIDEDKADIVRYIFREYSTGTIVSDIINKLTYQGILKKGKPFHKNTIYNMLANEKYTGVFHCDGEEYKDIYPRIVSDYTFDMVRKRLNINKYVKRSLTVEYLLKGKVYCGYCGSRISSETGTARNGEVLHYYKCLGRKNEHKCKKQVVRKETLEQLVIDTTLKLIDKPENVEMCANKILQVHNKRIAEQSVVNILIAERKEIIKCIDNIMSAIEQGITNNRTKQRMEQLEMQLQDIDSKLIVEQSKLAMQLTKEDIVSYLNIALHQEAKALINILIDKVVLYDDKIEIKYNYTDKPQIPPDNDGGIILYRGSISTQLAAPYKNKLNRKPFQLVLLI